MLRHTLRVGLLLLIILPSSRLCALPPGFSNELVVDGLTQAIGMRFLPDGRMLIIQKTGQVLIADPQAQPRRVRCADHFFSMPRHGTINRVPWDHSPNERNGNGPRSGPYGEGRCDQYGIADASEIEADPTLDCHNQNEVLDLCETASAVPKGACCVGFTCNWPTTSCRCAANGGSWYQGTKCFQVTCGYSEN